MLGVRSDSPPQSHSGVLVADAAGLALACAYSSSDEYEAAIIAERRAAGAYGSNRRPMVLLLAAVVAVAVLAIALT
jgi:hypothetical protein